MKTIDAAGQLKVTTATTITGGTTTQISLLARKGSGGTISQGNPVYVSGYNVGGWIEVEDADAVAAATMPAIGVATEDIDNTATKVVVMAGEQLNLNTAAWGVGDELWVANGGGLTNTRPGGGSDLIQKMAQVSRSHAVNGVLEVFGAGRANDVPNYQLYTEKAVPIAADLLLGEDSAASYANKRMQIGNLPYNKKAGVILEDPTGAEDATIFATSEAMEVQEINAVLLGSSTPSVTWTIRYAADRSAAGTEVVVGGTTTTSVTTGDTVLVFDNASIPVNNWVWLETTAQSGTVDQLAITIHF